MSMLQKNDYNKYSALLLEGFYDFKQSWGIKKLSPDKSAKNKSCQYSIDNIFAIKISQKRALETINKNEEENVNNRLSELLSKNRNNERVVSLQRDQMMLSCPQVLTDFIVKWLPLSSIINVSAELFNNNTNESYIIEPETFNSSQMSNISKYDFINDFVKLFPHENEQIIEYLAYELLNNGNFSLFMNNLSLFITINNLISHYINTGELVKLKNFNMQDNPFLVSNTYNNFNTVHIVFNDYTCELLELVFKVMPLARKKVSYSAHSNQISPLTSLAVLGLGNNTCIDFINVINAYQGLYSIPLNDFVTLYSHDKSVLIIGEQLEKCNFTNIELNRLTNSKHKNYVSPLMLRAMQECLIEIRNLLVGKEEKSEEILIIIDKIFNMEVSDDVNRCDVKKLYLIYSHVILLTQYDRETYNTMKTLFYDVSIFPDDMLESNIDISTEMIHLFIKSKGKVPFYLIENII